ncbi:MAG: FHA domain-containing protein [Bdellovibrionaceae bacterium]|nr:FHA domain-containing protein [Pseudobdellovibrionaceae bacterium]
MKIIAILHHGREIERFQLIKPTVFIGRSPTCDIILRAKSVKAVHFVIDWIGEGEFNSEAGLWSIVDISAQIGKESSSGEGVILSEDAPAQFGAFQFRVSKDELVESHLKRGVLRRSVNANLESENVKSIEGTCLEVVSIRNSLESVEAVNHFSSDLQGEVDGILKTFPQMKFVFADMHNGFFDTGGSPAEYEVLNKNELVVPKGQTQDRIQMSEKDILIIKSVDYDYYLRLVPKIEVVKGKEFTVDRTAVTVLLIILFLILFSFVVEKLPSRVEEKADNARIAFVEVVEPPPPPPPPPPEVVEEPTPKPPPEMMPVSAEPEPKPKPKPEVKPKAKPEPPKRPEPEPKPELKPDPSSKIKKGQGSLVKKGSPDAGGSPAGEPKAKPQGGLLSLIRKQQGSGARSSVKVDQILGSAPTPKNESEEGSKIVPLARPGSLGARPRLGDGGSETEADPKNQLKAAGSDLKSFVGTKKGGGDIAKPGGSVLEGGLPTGSSQGLGAGAVVGFDDGVTTEVSGGLGKDSVRIAIREYSIQFRGCYERALAESGTKNLGGKMSFYWKITPQGDVVESSLTYTDFKIPKFENCVKRIIDKIIFKKADNGQSTYVKYPFIFHGKK